MNTFVRISGKIGSQRHLVAIRDGFATAMPAIMAGSLAVLLNNIWTALKVTEPSWYTDFIRPVMGTVWWGSFAVLTILVIGGIAYRLAEAHDEDGLSAVVITLSSFMVLVPQAASADAGWGWVSFGGNFDSVALFAGIFTALISTEIYVKLVKAKLVIRMPEGVPPAVSKAFVALVPGMVSIFAFGIFGTIVQHYTEIGFIEWITDVIQKPIASVGQSPFTIILISFLIPLFWFFGLHGANLVAPVINSVYLPALTENAAAIEKMGTAPNLWTSATWDAFVHIGGSGATIALIIAILLFSKRASDKTVAKLGLAPGIFMINEPVLFGLPIVLNFKMLIPFIIIPPVLTVITLIFLSLKVIPPVYVTIPWTTPPVIGAFFATGGHILSALVALLNLGVAFLIYLPFVLMANKVDEEETVEE